MKVYLVKVWIGCGYVPMQAFVDKTEADKCAASYANIGKDVRIQELSIISKWEDE